MYSQDLYPWWIDQSVNNFVHDSTNCWAEISVYMYASFYWQIRSLPHISIFIIRVYFWVVRLSVYAGKVRGQDFCPKNPPETRDPWDITITAWSKHFHFNDVTIDQMRTFQQSRTSSNKSRATRTCATIHLSEVELIVPTLKRSQYYDHHKDKIQTWSRLSSGETCGDIFCDNNMMCFDKDICHGDRFLLAINIEIKLLSFTLQCLSLIPKLCRWKQDGEKKKKLCKTIILRM